MTDPFEVLLTPIEPVDPDPGFAHRLRARIERVLQLPEGVDMSNTTLDQEPTAVSAAVGGAVPYLAVADGRRALEWYVDVLGARAVGEPIVMPDGRIGHAELQLGAGKLYLAEEFPDIGHVAPSPAGSPVSLVLEVPDVDVTAALALAAGGRLQGEISEGYGHRNATVIDPFGHRWMLQSPVSTGAGGDERDDR